MLTDSHFFRWNESERLYSLKTPEKRQTIADCERPARVYFLMFWFCFASCCLISWPAQQHAAVKVLLLVLLSFPYVRQLFIRLGALWSYSRSSWLRKKSDSHLSPWLLLLRQKNYKGKKHNLPTTKRARSTMHFMVDVWDDCTTTRVAMVSDDVVASDAHGCDCCSIYTLPV